jgi:RNA polymerase sigma factor (sigma-70 family)
MAEHPVTRPSLLLRMRNAADAAAWSQFVDVYAPLIYGFARKQGLQDADAADLLQDVLRSIAGAISRLDYDPRRGSFRGWMFTIARNQMRDFIARRTSSVQGSGDTGVRNLLEQQPESDEAEWNIEYERRVFAWAAEETQKEVEAATWQAFWQTAVEGKSGKDVAADLQLSVAAVYLAKGRVMKRLKERIASLQDDAEADASGTITSASSVE